MSSSRYSGLYGNVAKKPNSGVQQCLAAGGFFGYGSMSQPGAQHFPATGAQRLPNQVGSQRQIHNMPRGSAQGPSQPECVPSSQPSLMYGSQYASQSQPSFGHESQSLVVPTSETPQRVDHGGARNPTHWSQQQHSSLARGLLSRAEATTTPTLQGPQAVAKLQIEQMMTLLESMSTRINELSKPSDVKGHVDTLSDHVDKKLAEFTSSLDIPARFTAIQKSVEELRQQQQSLVEHVQQYNQRPPVTLCHVPTQVSPVMRVSAAAQVCSPMLTGPRKRVSAGTQMTPQYQLAQKQRRSGCISRHEAPLAHAEKDPKLGYCTSHYDATERSQQQPMAEISPSREKHERPEKGLRHGTKKRASAENTTVLRNVTNKCRSHQVKQQEQSPPLVGKENAEAVGVHLNRQQAQKRPPQADQSTHAPARKQSRQTAPSVHVVMKRTAACSQHICEHPMLSPGFDDCTAPREAEADCSIPEQNVPLSSCREADMSADIEANLPHAADGCPSTADTANMKGSEGLQVSDSGQRTGGSIALVISGRTVSMSSLQKPQDDCHDLYQQLIVGKRCSGQPGTDEADSRPRGISNTRPKPDLACQALHSVLKKAKSASRTGTAAALPPQPKRHNVLEMKPQYPAAPATARESAIRNRCKGQQLPEQSSAVRSKASKGRGDSEKGEPGSAPCRPSGKQPTMKKNGHKHTLPKPNTTQRVSTCRRRPAGSQRMSLSSSLFAVDQTPRQTGNVARGHSDQALATIIKQRKRETVMMRRSGVLTMHENDPDNYMLPAQDLAEL